MPDETLAMNDIMKMYYIDNKLIEHELHLISHIASTIIIIMGGHQYYYYYGRAPILLLERAIFCGEPFLE